MVCNLTVAVYTGDRRCGATYILNLRRFPHAKCWVLSARGPASLTNHWASLANHLASLANHSATLANHLATPANYLASPADHLATLANYLENGLN